jgi:hypothetical protein
MYWYIHASERQTLVDSGLEIYTEAHILIFMKQNYAGELTSEWPLFLYDFI